MVRGSRCWSFRATTTQGSLVVVDATGNSRTLWTGTFRPRGLAWAPGGREIWFTYQNNRGATNLDAVEENGRIRHVTQFRGWAALLDIASDGRLLMTREKVRVGASCSRVTANPSATSRGSMAQI